ncbi:radial spoke head 14 homolog [Stegastes partitus]|nr:PREDICTED: rhabdoid tumor deletion region protein 1 [Stegastes partitus]
MDSTRAPVAFGRWAVPLLFGQLQQPQAAGRLRTLAALCDLLHDPERLQQTVTGGFLEQLPALLTDEDASVRTRTCELLHLVTAHSVGRQALLTSSVLPPLSRLLDDSSASCRTSVLRVLTRLALLPAGGAAVLGLVPKLMLKLQQQDDEDHVDEEVLLLSAVGRCSRLDARPALASDGVSVLGRKLSRRSPDVRREAAAAMMALSVPVDGKRQVCEGAGLPVLVGLLQDDDVEVQTNAAGVIMNTVIITTGKLQCLELDVVPVLLDLLSRQPEEDVRTKALLVYSLRALTALAEAPDGRRLLLQQLPLLARRAEARDPDVRRAAQTAVRVVTWTP